MFQTYGKSFINYEIINYIYTIFHFKKLFVIIDFFNNLSNSFNFIFL
jgi:hypothetical protein